MKCWQVGSGSGGRNYSDVFLRYGVMLIGHGNLGSARDNLGAISGHKSGSTIIAFAHEAQRDDVVILKRPRQKQWQIVAVGYIGGDYEWLEQFEDVEGWDLQHCRRVDWVRPRSQELVQGLAQGTFMRVHNKEIEGMALRVLDEGEKVETVRIPPPANRLSKGDLVASLINNGLHATNAENIIGDIEHVRCLASWYERYGRALSEHELRTFLIVPILQALGWSPRGMKIEWKYTDISLFREAFTRKTRSTEPEIVLESKRLRSGLNVAERQVVRKYAKKFPECNTLVTSTGARFQLYRKEPTAEWLARDMKENHLQAYMNLLKLKDRHPYLEGVGGAPDLLKSLMPG